MLERLGSKVSCFACAADCLEKLRFQRCDLLITDVRMPGMDGIKLLIEARRIIPLLPVVVITGYGDIPMAVRAMKAGASNFIEKPLERKGFLSIVESALKQIRPAKPRMGRPLTKAEMRIFRLLLEDKTNYEIAELLHRSVRTIEDHRHNIMRKFGTKTLAGLVRQAAALGLFEVSADL